MFNDIFDSSWNFEGILTTIRWDIAIVTRNNKKSHFLKFWVMTCKENDPSHTLNFRFIILQF